MKIKIITLMVAAGFGVSCSTTSSASSTDQSSYLLKAIQTYSSLDADGNGKLSKSEISGKLLENFSAIDTNNDSGLTLTELLSYKSLLGL